MAEKILLDADFPPKFRINTKLSQKDASASLFFKYLLLFHVKYFRTVMTYFLFLLLFFSNKENINKFYYFLLSPLTRNLTTYFAAHTWIYKTVVWELVYPSAYLLTHLFSIKHNFYTKVHQINGSKFTQHTGMVNNVCYESKWGC